jgi:hypothetical protein
MNQPTATTDRARDEALAIAAALRVAIAMAPERGWSSERTFREAERRALAQSPAATAFESSISHPGPVLRSLIRQRIAVPSRSCTRSSA